ncbi:hypothetical protein AAVH_23015 [Aphelenchoides avenae]|nr:hypothetical protein AAVH_23015 [Aphelenchus avenae]
MTSAVANEDDKPARTINELANRDGSDLCCWGKVDVRAALFDLLFSATPLVCFPLIICDLAAGSAGIYAFCAGEAWAWLPLTILNILKTVLFTTFAVFAFTTQLLLHTVYSKTCTANEKRVERMVLTVAAVVTVGYVLAACLFAWFATLAYHAFSWQRNYGVPAYQSCVNEKIGV